MSKKKTPSPKNSTPPRKERKEKAPRPVLLAAGIAVVQSIAVIIFGIFLIVREMSGADNASMVSDSGASPFVGLGTAIFLFIVFGFLSLIHI